MIRFPGPFVTVSFEKPGGTMSPHVKANVCRDFQIGYAGRTLISSNEGMLFQFPRDEDHEFYMRGVSFPLDIVFIGGNDLVAGIVENAKPFDETILRIGRPSRIVLEVLGGWCAEHGVKVGQRAVFG